MDCLLNAKRLAGRASQAERRGFAALSLMLCTAMQASAQTLGGSGPIHAPISLAELGAKACARYQGDGLSLLPAQEGARMCCVFQNLEGQATTEGLWLDSTADGARDGRFRLVARSVGREGGAAVHEGSAATRQEGRTPLTYTGTVTIANKLARFIRAGLIEEYSVSVEGIRQDFLILERPSGDGKLCIQLDIAQAKAEALVNGAGLVLEGSGRKIVYSQLRAVDAQNRQMAASMEVTSTNALAIIVDDAKARYPVRIDPTFSDANWASMGGLPGANDAVYAAVVDGWGNLYIGGHFTSVGKIAANLIAKWDGKAWSALGSGLEGEPGYDYVLALAVSGTNLYAGGSFTIAGGSAAKHIAKWDGKAWSALGSGLNDSVTALAAAGTDLYVGGWFTAAGGTAASHIAKWDGSAWSALGAGVSGTVSPRVSALVVSGTDLYVAGGFNMAGGSAAYNIAKWNGSARSALGLGLGYYASALAVSGTDLYVGGFFTNAGNVGANYVAKWNGSGWSALGPGVSSVSYAGAWVSALAISGNDLYVGGNFTAAGGLAATNIAKWNGSEWSTLASGMNDPPGRAVNALAV